MGSDSIVDIGIVVGPQSHFSGGILRGFLQYVRPTRAWRLRQFTGPVTDQLARLGPLPIAGLLAHVALESEMEAVAATGLATVCTTSRVDPAAWGDPRMQFVTIDEREVGRTAARHFLALGYRHLAAFQMTWIRYHREREAGFREVVQAAGGSYEVFWANRLDPSDFDSARVPAVDDEVIADWLVGLAKPCAVFFADIGYADHCIDLARLRGVAVPAELAVLAGHDHPQVAECAQPPISAVDLPFQQLGYLAGRELDRLLSGESARALDALSPLGVIERGSTAAIGASQPKVTAAMAYIDQHALEPCTPEDVLSHVGCSRSYLDGAFRAHVGRTVFAEIRRRQIEAAKHLLVHTQEPMDAVAESCGFGSAYRFSKVFKQAMGVTPTAYRRRFARR